jgi:hypothetical protein
MRSHRARGVILTLGFVLYAWLTFTDWPSAPQPSPVTAHGTRSIEPELQHLEPAAEPPARPLALTPTKSVSPASPASPATPARSKQRYVDRFDVRRNDY